MKSNLKLWAGGATAHRWLVLTVLATATCMGAEVKVVGPAKVSVTGPDTTPPTFTLTLSVTPPSATVSAGTVVPLAAKLDSNGVTILKPVLWTSSDSTVVSVTTAGVATALKPGSASVTATSGGLASNVAFSVVAVPVASVTVAPPLDTLQVGTGVQLTATTKDASSNTLFGRLVSWVSSNIAAATVDGTGKVQSKAVGSATITATSEGQSNTATIVVVNVPVASVTVTTTKDTVQIGQTITFTATTKDGGGGTLTGRLVTWSSSDTTIAKVNSSGQVTGRAAGAAVITATSEGVSGTHGVTVIPVPVATVQVSPAAVQLQVGAKTTLVATARDANGALLSGRLFAWASGNVSVGTVDTAGLVTGVDTGGVSITATSEGKTGSAQVTVQVKPPTGEPDLLAGDVVNYSETFDQYASTAALKAAYAHTETHGTINLDTVVSFGGGKSFRIDWSNDGCLGSGDADVEVDKKVGDSVTTDRNWYLRYHARFTPGYQFAWDQSLCIRGAGSKEVLLFRNTNNTGGRITWSAIKQSNECPSIQANVSGLLWHYSVDKEPGSVQPSQCSGSISYRQYLAQGSKDPASVADGQWHRVTIHIKRESAIDAGDGVIQTWIDGVLIMDYNGEDAGNPAFHQVFTRTMPLFNPIQYQSILNAGAPQGQSRWFDEFLVWHRP
jgi:uncharacterized protein YjdB